MKIKNFFKELVGEIKKDKIAFTVYALLRGLTILILVLSLISKNYENAFVCILSLALFLVPAFIEKKLSVSLPTVLEIIIMLFIFCAEILGEMNSYYTKYPFWDTMLHTVNGFICAAIGFAMVDILNQNEKIKFQLSPAYLAVAAFCFSMTIGVIWEFFEFFCDIYLKTDMQKDFIVNSISSVALNPNGLNEAVKIENITECAVNGKILDLKGYLDIGLFDTMKDLIVNFIGAVIFSVIGFFYVKNRGKSKFAKNFIPTLNKKDDKK